MTRLPTMKHKYNAVPTEFNGRRYSSKKEARYAQTLETLKNSGQVLFYLPQVNIPLKAGYTYRVDFLEFWANGDIHWTDCKGFKTPEYKLKKKQVESEYPFRIEEV